MEPRTENDGQTIDVSNGDKLFFPDWIRTVEMETSDGDGFTAPIIDGTSTLLYLADQAMITPHLYLSPANSLKYPE